MRTTIYLNTESDIFLGELGEAAARWLVNALNEHIDDLEFVSRETHCLVDAEVTFVYGDGPEADIELSHACLLDALEALSAYTIANRDQQASLPFTYEPVGVWASSESKAREQAAAPENAMCLHREDCEPDTRKVPAHHRLYEFPVIANTGEWLLREDA